MRNQVLMKILLTVICFIIASDCRASCGRSGSIDERVADCSKKVGKLARRSIKGFTWQMVYKSPRGSVLWQDVSTGKVWTGLTSPLLSSLFPANSIGGNRCFDPTLSKDEKGNLNAGVFFLPGSEESLEAVDHGLQEIFGKVGQIWTHTPYWGYDQETVLEDLRLEEDVSLINNLSIRCVFDPKVTLFFKKFGEKGLHCKTQESPVREMEIRETSAGNWSVTWKNGASVLGLHRTDTLDPDLLYRYSKTFETHFVRLRFENSNFVVSTLRNVISGDIQGDAYEGDPSKSFGISCQEL